MDERIGVTAAVIQRDGLVLIGKRRAGGYCGGSWEFPGGKIEKGESPEECLARELREELGVECRIGTRAGESLFDYRDRRIRLVAFYAQLTAGEPEPLDHEELQWVKPEDLRSYSFVSADLPIVEILVAGGTATAIQGKGV